MKQMTKSLIFSLCLLALLFIYSFIHSLCPSTRSIEKKEEKEGEDEKLVVVEAKEESVKRKNIKKQGK